MYNVTNDPVLVENIKEYFKTTGTKKLISLNKFLFNCKYLHLLKNKKRIYFCFSDHLLNDDLLSRQLRFSYAPGLHQYSWINESNELLDFFQLKDSEVKTIEYTALGVFDIPEDINSFTHNNVIKIVDLPKYKSTFKVLEGNDNHSLLYGLHSVSHVYPFLNDLYSTEIDLGTVLNLTAYRVYDIDHDSDEAYLMEYFEYNSVPLCIVTKYADKSDHQVTFYDSKLGNEFIQRLQELVREEDEYELPVIDSTSTETPNHYGRTITFENELYSNINNPFWCLGYSHYSDTAYLCTLTDFSDVKMEKVKLLDYKKIRMSEYDDGENCLVQIELNGVQSDVLPSNIFFKVQP